MIFKPSRLSHCAYVLITIVVSTTIANKLLFNPDTLRLSGLV
nr:MAG TPA: hypothetical protein [Caudoviricetes sp.]